MSASRVGTPESSPGGELLACPPKPLGRRRSRSAFTLIELLVVIAIISLLISMAMPSIQHARRAAYGTACRANLRTLGQAMYMHVGDNNGDFPFYGYPSRFGFPDGTGFWLSTGTQWDVQLMPYLGITWTWGSAMPPADLGNRPTVFYCPGGLPFHRDPGFPRNYARSNSYNYNRPLGENMRGSRNLAMLEDPINTFLLMDAHRFDDWTGFVCHAPTYLGRDRSGYMRFQETNIGDRSCYHRHNERIMILFADSHVDDRPRSSHGSGAPAGTRFGNGYALYPYP